MGAPGWDTRFLESTRGRIVELLRRGPHTVDELAEALGLTDNAVRLHLAALERDDVARSAGVRRGGSVGKPATLYSIAPEAEPSFSRAYIPFLATLLESLGERLTARELRAIMRDVGHRLAGAQPPAGDDARGRALLASGILNALGGVTRVEEGDDGVRIVGCGCPLAVAVSRREEVCVAVETMLRDVIGAPVQEHCDRGERPACSFKVRISDPEEGDGR